MSTTACSPRAVVCDDGSAIPMVPITSPRLVSNRIECRVDQNMAFYPGLRHSHYLFQTRRKRSFE